MNKILFCDCNGADVCTCGFEAQFKKEASKPILKTYAQDIVRVENSDVSPSLVQLFINNDGEIMYPGRTFMTVGDTDRLIRKLRTARNKALKFLQNLDHMQQR